MSLLLFLLKSRSSLNLKGGQANKKQRAYQTFLKAALKSPISSFILEQEKINRTI